MHGNRPIEKRSADHFALWSGTRRRRTALRRLDALVFDLQDIGTRTWTYVGAMIYSMRAAARARKTMIVLDRPNPITGFYVEGPVLDSALANPNDPAPGNPDRRTRSIRCRCATA